MTYDILIAYVRKRSGQSIKDRCSDDLQKQKSKARGYS